MITEIRLRDFKNFKDATLRLGPFTVLVGTNGSGKSNIRDAFRFLHGIGRGYTLADIIGGRYGAGGQPEWSRIILRNSQFNAVSRTALGTDGRRQVRKRQNGSKPSAKNAPKISVTYPIALRCSFLLSNLTREDP